MADFSSLSAKQFKKLYSLERFYEGIVFGWRRGEPLRRRGDDWHEKQLQALAHSAGSAKHVSANASASSRYAFSRRLHRNKVFPCHQFLTISAQAFPRKNKTSAVKKACVSVFALLFLSAGKTHAVAHRNDAVFDLLQFLLHHAAAQRSQFFGE